ncbi:tripartite tricarboxylate transporter TctB family protein [Halotalea alkalilenta]|uniref:tripartite tricarboxylate transporter TctB family protein n=1 Tax=Halotalea alkalilenta TaxID=376489 RepID=UPI000487D550|nr:tripartite tricarboxylate transporter TctB family protein [Halotalea alkalilenta]
MADKHVSRHSMEITTALLTGAIGVTVCIGAWQAGVGWEPSGPSSGYFPFYIGVLIVLASLVNLGRALIWKRHLDEVFLDGARARSVARFTLPLVGYAAVSVVLGLYVGTFLYMLFAMRLQGSYRWWVAASTGAAVSACFYLIFEIGFQVPLLKGPLEAWLGIY